MVHCRSLCEQIFYPYNKALMAKKIFNKTVSRMLEFHNLAISQNIKIDTIYKNKPKKHMKTYFSKV